MDKVYIADKTTQDDIKTIIETATEKLNTLLHEHIYVNSYQKQFNRSNLNADNFWKFYDTEMKCHTITFDSSLKYYHATKSWINNVIGFDTEGNTYNFPVYSNSANLTSFDVTIIVPTIIIDKLIFIQINILEFAHKYYSS